MTRRGLLLTLVSALSVAAAQGSTVRGRLVRQGPRGDLYAAQGIPVRLTHQQYGPSSFAYTDTQGMYYLFNVPPGDFVLEVWLSKERVLRYAVRVYAQRFTDVPQIVVP